MTQYGLVSPGSGSGSLGSTIDMRNLLSGFDTVRDASYSRASTLLDSGVHNAKRQLFCSPRGREVQLGDVPIVALDADHGTLRDRLAHCVLADHALIGEDTGHLDGHAVAGARLPEVDHHRDPRSDGHPFIAAVEVAVPEPAPAPVRLPLYRTFGRVLDVLPIRDPDSGGANVAGDDGREVRTASHGSVDTQFSAP